ncbi:cation-translocating P-type ATPase [Mycoplasmoides pirum]|uniref:cation-translocating P-type ATPase n=1 Tax=Mycoplasmoides pirum TaxID=2122 RepID=UPI000483D63D|nr:cation-translocating P-type ATPase [Mycoplasmoides pirum]
MSQKSINVDQLNEEKIENLLNTDINRGLSSIEANERLKKFGKNLLPEKKEINFFILLIKQFKDLMMLILMGAIIASFVVAIISGVNNSWNFDENLIIEFVQPFIIILVVITNALLGAFQERKSERAIKSLKKLSILNSKVIRDGKLISISSSNLVVGDVLVLEAGDQVGADAKLVLDSNLKVIESALTGESLPILKDSKALVNESMPIGDQLNKVFSSCSVVSGSGTAIVYATGKNTQIGNIAKLLNEEKIALTPLQMKLNKLSSIFGYVGIGLFVLTFIIQIAILGFANISNTWSIALVGSISLAVAAIPEGLSAFTTVILSLGIRNMAKQQALIKNLSAVETLGSTAVICTDKTGTLTENKIQVVNIWTQEDGELLDNPKSSHLNLIEKSILCTDASINIKDGNYEYVGDPTETALIFYGMNNKLDKKELIEKYPRLKVIPFDSKTKTMTVVNAFNDKNIVIVKGAPEIILDQCINVDKETINKIIQNFSKQAYRTLAIAFKTIVPSNTDELLENDLKNDLNFLGVVAMIDPPRTEIKSSIQECWHAGIKPVMITGDHIDTAISIAKDIGIMRSDSLAIDGPSLNTLSDDQLKNNIEKYSVFARVNPSDKLRIVKAWQSNDQVVAMTGDGVNDAPALKAADIGCAMGITGTDVSKDASDMILMDDNFTTIISSVKNGRRIYHSIRKVVQNLLISSIAEILVVFFGLIVLGTIYQSQIKLYDPNFEILSALQLLWVNLLVHGVPGVALGIQQSNVNVMNKRPFSKYESIFARRMGIDLIWQGFLIGFLSLLAYSLGIEYALNSNNVEIAKQFNLFGSSASFLVIGIAASIHALNLMNEKSILKSNVVFYKLIYLSVLFSVSMILLVAFIPQIAPIFNMTSMIFDYPILIGYGIGFALIPTFLIEMQKFVLNLLNKKKTDQILINDFQMIPRPKSIFKNFLSK